MSRRKEQIVDAALELLASVPVEKLSTRAVAERVGVTQPALFRHFRSRDEILKAVVQRVVGRLQGEMGRILEDPTDPMTAVGDLARVLFTIAHEHPGVPALFLHDSADRSESGYREPLRSLSAMPAGIVATLMDSARRAGQLPHPVDSACAAALFVALVQGTLLQTRRSGHHEDPTASAATVVAFWKAAVVAGQPPLQGDTPQRSPATTAAPSGLQALDVRPEIARGTDPLEAILTAIETIRPDGALVLTVPFLPRPLLSLLAGRGWRHAARQLDKALWAVELLAERAADPIDLTELEAPEPMERVLLRTGSLAPGQSALFRLPRRPASLLVMLQERNCIFELVESTDGRVLLYVRTPAEGS